MGSLTVKKKQLYRDAKTYASTLCIPALRDTHERKDTSATHTKKVQECVHGMPIHFIQMNIYKYVE